jgi:hypothetical protein
MQLSMTLLFINSRTQRHQVIQLSITTIGPVLYMMAFDITGFTTARKLATAPHAALGTSHLTSKSVSDFIKSKAPFFSISTRPLN